MTSLPLEQTPGRTREVGERGDRFDPTVEDQALHWFVLLQDRDASDADRAGCAAWRTAAPEHEQAWRELERLWGGLDRLAADAAERATHRSRRRKAVAALACFLLAAVLGSRLAPPVIMERVMALTADYASGIGERRTVSLSDGTTVALSTATAIDIEFRADARHVHLRSGEAFFDVRHDASRPFVVTARNGTVRVLGTSFDVKIAEDVTVAVASNSVEVALADPLAAKPPVRVAAGQKVRYDAGGVSAVTEIDRESIGAWREDRLVFRDAPLKTVLAELERHRGGWIRLSDPSIGARRITAVFDSRRTDAAIDTIARNFGLRVHRIGGLFVDLAADSEKQPPH